MKHNQCCPPPDRDAGVRVGETEVGRGLFVTRDFAAGAEVLVFRGRVIDFAATLAKGDRECDAYQIGPDCYLDLEPPGVFINHSCSPNVGVRDDVRLVAIRDLTAGEEIRFDYSTSMDEDHWTLECRCGSPLCRRNIRDFRWLPREMKLEFLQRNIVPRFLIASELGRGGFSADEIRTLLSPGNGYATPAVNPTLTAGGRLAQRYHAPTTLESHSNGAAP